MRGIQRLCFQRNHRSIASIIFIETSHIEIKEGDEKMLQKDTTAKCHSSAISQPNMVCVLLHDVPEYSRLKNVI